MSENTRPPAPFRSALPGLAAALLITAGAGAWVGLGEGEGDLLEPFVNPTGAARTISTAGPVDRSNPFFQELGTNGRTCLSTR